MTEALHVILMIHWCLAVLLLYKNLYSSSLAHNTFREGYVAVWATSDFSFQYDMFKPMPICQMILIARHDKFLGDHP